ncbi:MAG: hypothetical protein HYX62_06500 [Gammaproteobacteria bacterium]|jgi:hypothetical protein|nr:hypothetical protein [Gammaproteobacteria bacterium]
MSRIPGSEQAVVDIAKLRDYCLSMDHPEGRHKARVFFSALSMTVFDAEELHEVLLDGVRSNDATPMKCDLYGQRYSVDVLVKRGNRKAVIRSGWIVRTGEGFPRLTSCYVLRGER